MKSQPRTPPRFPIDPLPDFMRPERYHVSEWIVCGAVLDILISAPQRGLFTSLTNPVWSGWTSAPALAWHLRADISEAHYAKADPEDRFQDAGQYLGEIMLRMVDQRLLEKRLTCPFRHNPSPDMSDRQDWEFRLPGDAGYCHWEPAQPAHLRDTDDWGSLVNERHLEVLTAILADTDSTVPPYVLARIERIWQFQAKKRRVLLY